MAPVTLQRFMRELDKLKQATDAGTLKPQDYDGRLARIIGELRDLGLDADRADATAALAFLGAQLTTYVGKFAVGRDRPEFLDIAEAQFASFPSGHTTGAMAVYGFIAYAMARDLPFRVQFELAYWTGIVVLLVGFSRLLLGVHFLTDVLGGLLVGSLVNAEYALIGSIVAVGSIVTEGTVIPPGSVAMGQPAKVRREATDCDRERSKVPSVGWNESVEDARQGSGPQHTVNHDLHWQRCQQGKRARQQPDQEDGQDEEPPAARAPEQAHVQRQVDRLHGCHGLTWLLERLKVGDAGSEASVHGAADGCGGASGLQDCAQDRRERDRREERGDHPRRIQHRGDRKCGSEQGNPAAGRGPAWPHANPNKLSACPVLFDDHQESNGSGSAATGIAVIAGHVQNYMLLGYGRDFEFEADEVGLRYAKRAGYDPRRMVSFLRWMRRRERSTPRQRPPTSSTRESWSGPIANAASSEARKAITCATASVVTQPERSASGIAARLAGVSMVLGRTAFTVMP